VNEGFQYPVPALAFEQNFDRLRYSSTEITGCKSNTYRVLDFPSEVVSVNVEG